MKFKFILIAVCLILGKYTSAQSYNLEDLKQLVKLSIENFDSKVAEKGFKYLKTDEYLKCERTSYELNDELIAIGFCKEFTQLFLATNLNTYKLIKGSLIQNQFKYNGKKVSDLGSMIFTYKKLNVEVKLIVFPPKSSPFAYIGEGAEVKEAYIDSELKKAEELETKYFGKFNNYIVIYTVLN